MTKPMEFERQGDLPLSEYAVIGDGVTAALVARDGAIDWLCYGRFDGAGVFCRLLDADCGGYFQVAPSTEFRATRRYVGRTNVLETDFECATGTMRLTDAMPLGATAGPVVLRRLQGNAGAVPVRIDFVPKFDFGRAVNRVEEHPGGCTASGAGQRLSLACPAMRIAHDHAGASFELRAGQTRWIALTHGGAPFDLAAAERSLRSTLDAWERWSARGRYPATYEYLVRRSALVLKALIHSPTGAMVAAPTTSLPETPGEGRNWDYRFTWLRDASWLISALMELGYHDESMAFLGWLESLDLGNRGPAVLYDVDGESPCGERELHHLRGYRGSRPVRIGNAAALQDQHDIFGEVVSAIHMCSERMPSMRPLRRELWRVVTRLADMAAAHWPHADCGMWEVRDRPRQFVSSKLLCWTALDRALAIARRDRLPGPLATWRVQRERIRSAILGAGFDENLGSFRRAFGESDSDATLLLLARSGFLPVNDPRMIRTVKVVVERLATGSLLRRYRVPDGILGTEGAFTACSFWLADCLARQGRIREARAAFEDVAALASDVGLLSEDIDVESGDLLGNYPQAFTHLALINAAVAIDKAERRPSTAKAV